MRYRVAIGTKDKLNITEHFGQCSNFSIIEIDQETDENRFVEDRKTDFSLQCGEHHDEMINSKIEALKDCQIVLVNQIGGQSEKLLQHNGIIALQSQSSIESALRKIQKFYKRQIFAGRDDIDVRTDK